MSSCARDTIMDVWDGLRSQPARMGLSFMAICVGIVALTILLAVLQGLRNRADQVVRDLGVGVFAVSQGREAPTGLAHGRLERKHMEVLSAGLPGCQLSALRVLTVPVVGSGESVKVACVDSSFAAIRQWKVTKGRFLDPTDLAGRERSVVVGVDLCRARGWRRRYSSSS